MSTRHSAQSQATAAASDFACDVQYYLRLHPRQLPSRYFYDALGSALFDAICELPWYAITRLELDLLSTRAAAIFERAGSVARIVELGPGNGTKLQTLVAAAGERRRRLALHLVDVSEAALNRAARTLDTLEAVEIVTHTAPYESGLVAATAEASMRGPTLVLFLGSNIGNFDRPGADAFLRNLRSALVRGDSLLLGADLVKPREELLLAYDDPLGVTAAFNRNLLVRINRELGGTFDIAHFAHRATWNESESRVEMHLVSTAPQRVCVEAAGLDFEMPEGETIWTESSYKYRPATIRAMLERAGFRLLDQWVAGEGDEGAASGGFALTLAVAA